MTLFPSPACAQCTVFNGNNSTLPLKLLSMSIFAARSPGGETGCAQRDLVAGQESLCKVSIPRILVILGKNRTMQFSMHVAFSQGNVAWRQRRCGCRHCLNQMFITFQIPETWGLWKRMGSWGVALMYGILRKPTKAGWLSLLYEETGRKPPSWNRLQTCCPLGLWLPHHENCGKTWCYCMLRRRSSLPPFQPSYSKDKVGPLLFMIKPLFSKDWAMRHFNYKRFCTAYSRNNKNVFISKGCLKSSCNPTFVFKQSYDHLWLSC